MSFVVGALIALIVVAICVALSSAQQTTPDTSRERKAPDVEEGRKIAVARGTVWVTSTQITVYHEPYDD